MNDPQKHSGVVEKSKRGDKTLTELNYSDGRGGCCANCRFFDEEIEGDGDCELVKRIPGDCHDTWTLGRGRCDAFERMVKR